MKITRGQIRALEENTRGFVDSLDCELDDNGESVVLRYHHICVVAERNGRWQVHVPGEEVGKGTITRCENDGWDGLKV
jgi:hypothetical protein